MIKYSILSPNAIKPDKDEIREPSFFIDLNLDKIVEAIFQMKREYDLKEYFYCLPMNKLTTRYRQEILQDIEQEEVFQAFTEFSEEVKKARGYRKQCDEVDSSIQSDRLRFDALLCYYRSIEVLRQKLLPFDCQSEGLQTLQRLLTQMTETEEFKIFQVELLELEERFDKMRIRVTIQQNFLKIVTEDSKEDYCKRFLTLFPNEVHKAKEKEFLLGPIQFQSKLSKFEELSMELYKNKEKELFAKLRHFSQKYEKFMETWILDLEQEVQFYLAFLLFIKIYEGKDYHFTIPKIIDTNEVMIQDGYDLALLMKNLYHDTPVITNDIAYWNTERFMVVTGPNQGGKTTFARSIGQIVYFALLGLKVPCTKARLPMFHTILTHFSVEESLETGRGKLKEELIRLAPMMERDDIRSFVIINELFTTAASYDAYIMGKRVMEHFIAKDCYGIYVTHIQELAKETEEIVSLCATVDELDPRTRTYKIVRRQAEGHGYANGLVEKYQLTYSDIKRRLRDEGISAISES